MARGKEFDDLEVVRAARDLFSEHGCASTSLAQLQAATGLSKSSLYENYGSKRGLFARVVANYTEEFIDVRLKPLEVPDPGVVDLIACFDGLASYLRSAPDHQARWGCLTVNVAVQLSDLDDTAAETVAAFQRRMSGGFARADLSGPGPGAGREGADGGLDGHAGRRAPGPGVGRGPR